MTNTFPCRQIVLVVSYEITGSNGQTPSTGLNKTPPHRGRGSVLMTFVTAWPNHVDIVRFGPKEPSQL